MQPKSEFAGLLSPGSELARPLTLFRTIPRINENRELSLAAMSNDKFIKRAFDLADSGNYSRVSEIRAMMTREGFTLREVNQLSGKQLAGQLRTIMTMAVQRPKAAQR